MFKEIMRISKKTHIYFELCKRLKGTSFQVEELFNDIDTITIYVLDKISLH